ncbi:MAG: carotenoid biosynthesis protein [Methanomicrobiaceae archaeon]|nr:carotenoid biosynthesis protein [Methanomicrobiaceae archaeon]
MKRPIRIGVGAAATAFFLTGLLFVRFSEASYVAGVSAFFVLLLALPSYAGYAAWLGLKRSVSLVCVLSVLPLLVEALAVATGFPYGIFSYGDVLGWKVFGLVPWTVAFAYPPLLLGVVALARHLAGPYPRKLIPIATGLLVAADLVIDPAAVHAGFWSWEEYGWYYGIPPVNFAGWVLTGALYITIIWWFVKTPSAKSCLDPVAGASSMLLILAFWTGYLLREGLFFPAAIGMLLMLGSAVIVHSTDAGNRQ